MPFAKQAAKAATLDTRLPRAGTTTGTERTPKAKSLSLAMDEQRATKSRAKEKQRGGSFSWTGRGKASRAFKRLGTVLNVVRLSKGRLAPVRIATAIAV